MSIILNNLRHRHHGPVPVPSHIDMLYIVLSKSDVNASTTSMFWSSFLDSIDFLMSVDGRMTEETDEIYMDDMEINLAVNIGRDRQSPL